MVHRNRHIAIPAAGIWLILAAVLASSIPTAEARRRRRSRRKKARVAKKVRVDRDLKQVGSPKVVVVRRQNVRAFRLASLAFRKGLAFPTGEVVLDPATPASEQLEDIDEAKPKVILALGPGAASVVAKGGAGVPVVFAYVAGRPVTAVRQGGWLSVGASSRRVLVWLRRLVGRLRRVAVVVRDGKGSLARDFRAACARLGLQPVIIVAASARNVVRQIVAALKQRPDGLWLGHHVGLYPPSVLRQIQRIQVQFRLPVVGLTRLHVKQGLVLAVDATPAQIARAARRLIRSRVARWLVPVGGRGRRVRVPARASQLFGGVVEADRVTLNRRTARAIGLNPKAALKAGAQKVRP
jgi:hypothetical protein